MKILNCSAGQSKIVTVEAGKVNPIKDNFIFEQIGRADKAFCAYYCDCGKKIDAERVEAMKFLGKLQSEFTCIDCQKKNDFKVKGFYNGGLSGVSPLVVVKKLEEETHFADSKEIFNDSEFSGEEFFGAS